MRYIGNKTKIIKNIKELDVFQDSNLTICDLFAGTGTIGDNFKENNIIISNDSQLYSYYLNIAKIKNKDIPKFLNFKNIYNISIWEYLNQLTIDEIKNNKIYDNSKIKFIIRDNYSPKGNRMYFTEENGEKIDLIRFSIECLYNEHIIDFNEYVFLISSLLDSCSKFSNITGTYEAFLKNWDNRALKQFDLLPLEINKVTKLSNKNIVYNEDSNNLIKKIKGDILYLDPPYTKTEYSAAYHIFETIVKYEEPIIKGITGRPQDRINSNYTRKNYALKTLEDIIKNAQFPKIILSYSTHGLIPIEDLEQMLNKYDKNSNVQKIKINYREFKNINKTNKDKLYELLYIINKDLTVIRSPLNYSGSKYNLFNDINNYIPNDISTFVDCFGGAFNMGVNIKSKKVIYNEYNDFTYNIIEMLLNSDDKEKLIDQIESIINHHNLQAGNKETYIKFRKYYNEVEPSTINLFILSMYCFQNQMRFNSKHEFNSPVGNSGYNPTIKQRIRDFKPKTKNYKLMNSNFYDLKYKDYDKNSLFYFDPPYLITNATYNDGKRGFKGWDRNEELKLLDTLDNLNKQGYKFALSNVIEHKDNINRLLLDWATENKYKIINLTHSKRKEVLIINYDIITGTR